MHAVGPVDTNGPRAACERMRRQEHEEEDRQPQDHEDCRCQEGEVDPHHRPGIDRLLDESARQ